METLTLSAQFAWLTQTIRSSASSQPTLQLACAVYQQQPVIASVPTTTAPPVCPQPSPTASTLSARSMPLSAALPTEI